MADVFLSCEQLLETWIIAQRIEVWIQAE